MRDLIAKVGADNCNVEHVTGKWSISSRNENGDMLVEACSSAGLIIIGPLFPHKHCHQDTWISADNVTENQIDHFCIFKTWNSCLLDVRVVLILDLTTTYLSFHGNRGYS